MEVLVIISSVLSLITLICFFVLCSNVGRIKLAIIDEDGTVLQSKFDCAMAFGDTEQAKAYFKQIVWNYITLINKRQGSVKERIRLYEQFEQKHKLTFDKLSLSFPDKDACAKA